MLCNLVLPTRSTPTSRWCEAYLPAAAPPRSPRSTDRAARYARPGHRRRRRRLPGDLRPHDPATASFYKVVRCKPGQPISEGEIFATVAAAHSVPTALIAGDDVVCARMEKFVPGIETACVKSALPHSRRDHSPRPRMGLSARQTERSGAARERDRDSRVRAAVPLRDRTASAAQRRGPLSAFAERFPEFTIEGDRTVTFSDRDMRVLSACGSHVVYRRRSRVGAHLPDRPG